MCLYLRLPFTFYFRLLTISLLSMHTQDQLSDTNNGRALGWLPFDSLPANVTIVASTLPTEGGCLDACKNKVDDAKAFYISVPALDEGEGMIVCEWLKKDGRSLTESQMAHFLDSFREADAENRTPLLLSVQVCHSRNGPYLTLHHRFALSPSRHSHTTQPVFHNFLVGPFLSPT